MDVHCHPTPFCLCCSMAASIKRQEEKEYLAPCAVYQARFVETAGYVDIETNTPTHMKKVFLSSSASRPLRLPLSVCRGCPRPGSGGSRCCLVRVAASVLCASFCCRRVPPEPGRIGGVPGRLGTSLPDPQRAARPCLLTGSPAAGRG